MTKIIDPMLVISMLIASIPGLAGTAPDQHPEEENSTPAQDVVS